MSLPRGSRFGIHADVLAATPEDDESRVKLIDEIKSRGRAEFARKNFPLAEVLYARAAEVMPNDATLHSNLAAAYLGLNKLQPALESATKAVNLDPSYAKGLYRKGQAHMGLSQFAQAADAFRAGASLEPESKLWAPLIQKAVKAAEDRPVETPKRTTTPASASTTHSAEVSKPSAPSGTRVRETTSDGGSGTGMKGYKKTADGRVTTYFHQELSEEAKALIGDIAPKRLEPSEAGMEDGGGSATNGIPNDASAWNKAGTWESRDMTTWAKQRLTELLVGAEFDAPESSVEVIKIENLNGDAEITFSRGRKRYMFDFRFELKWEAGDLDAGPAKGVLVYPDVGQDCDGEYDVECRVDSLTPSAAKGFIDRHVRSEGSGLRQVILSRLAIFVSELNSK